MGKTSRNKGASWERMCCTVLSSATGIEHGRNLSESRRGNDGDIERNRLPFVYQCKVGALPPIWQALEQAREACEGGEIPVALIKRNSVGSGLPARELAVVPLDVFCAMVGRMVEAGLIGQREAAE